MDKKFEVSIGDYGRMMFEMMTNSGEYHMPKHWSGIKDRAEPLVRELLRLNDEMGYEIIGYHDEKGRKKISKRERIRQAQKKMWLVKANTLEERDRVWLDDSDYEMYISEDQPCPVEYVKDEYVAVDTDRQYGIVRVWVGDKVFKAPNDWDEQRKMYVTDEYWLEQAERLGL